MKKKDFLQYFKKRELVSNTNNENEVTITNIVTSATEDISNAELTFVEEEIQKSIKRPEKYQKAIPEQIKREVGMYANDFGTASAIKKFTVKYDKYIFNRTTVNSWKNKYNSTIANKDVVFKKAGRPNLLDNNLIKKVKDIAIGTRAAGGVINRKQIINIAKGVVRANNPNSLKEFGGTLELTDRWARDLLITLDWCKRKGTTGKIEPSPQFLAEEKFTFQRAISAVVSEHDIPPQLIINLDQTPLSYVSPGKYTFSFRGSKNVPIKGVDDKRQITGTFAVTLNGTFLPVQLIYQGKSNRCLPKFKFPRSFSVSYTENHWSNTEKSIEFFEEIIFPYINMVKEEKGYPKEQHCLIIMDTFKGQDNDVLKELCSDNNCKVVIVPHNLTNKFQPLDISVNKAAKAFIQNRYNEWFSNQVSIQLKKGTDPADVKVSSKLSDLKPLHASWIVDLYKEKVENPFREA